MDIVLRKNEKLRIYNSNNDIFLDINSNESEISIEPPPMYFHQLRKKERFLKMYSVKKIDYFDDIDFGYYSDAEIVWKSY